MILSKDQFKSTFNVEVHDGGGHGGEDEEEEEKVKQNHRNLALSEIQR